MNKNNGGPAFPTDSEHQSGTCRWHYQGMTLRDYFAAKAMQGDWANSNQKMSQPRDYYAMADAMIEERSKYYITDDNAPAETSHLTENQ